MLRDPLSDDIPLDVPRKWGHGLDEIVEILRAQFELERERHNPGGRLRTPVPL